MEISINLSSKGNTEIDLIFSMIATLLTKNENNWGSSFLSAVTCKQKFKPFISKGIQRKNSFRKSLRNKKHCLNVLLKRFYLNRDTIGFCLKIKKLMTNNFNSSN